MYNCATPSESMASLHGRNMDALLQSVSVIVRIVSYSPDGGNFVMKSMAIVSNGLAFCYDPGPHFSFSGPSIFTQDILCRLTPLSVTCCQII